MRVLCKVLEVPKSVYYDWVKSPFGKRKERIDGLDKMIKDIFYEHECRYGSLRIFNELKQRGVRSTRNMVAKRMEELELVPKARRKFKITTTSDHKMPVANNILQQDFKASKLNEKWVTDITYIQTKEGWLYLCVYIDLFSRAVIGWSLGENMKTELVLNALRMALFKRDFPTGTLIHSDRGSQYCSREYQMLLRDYHMICSMSAAGCCYDNAVAESFFHTLKVELVHDEVYETREKARTSIVEYIECYYNRKRMHSSIGFMSPAQFEIMGCTA